jgi:hypothetical protein
MMSDGNTGEPEAASENTEAAAASPDREALPDSPPSHASVDVSGVTDGGAVTRTPAQIARALLEERFFRPPGPNATTGKPRESLAPIPRIRPDAPRGVGPFSDVQPAAEPLSPADELAGMLEASRASAAAPVGFERMALTTAPGHLGTTPAALPRGSHPHGSHDPFFFRKTIIPISLSCALVLAIWAGLLLTAGQFNALPDLFPHWTSLALLAGAALFAIIGVANAFSLRRRD